MRQRNHVRARVLATRLTVFVSVGHLIDLPGAERVVLACANPPSDPGATRLADHLAGAAKRAME